MKASLRFPVLLAILAVLVGLVFFDDHGDGAVHGIVDARLTRSAPEPTAHLGDATPSGSAGNSGELPTLLALRERRSEAPPSSECFETRDWTPPPPPPPPPAPPPPPQAPALPFSYLGKQMEAGKWTVFLADQERTYVVREGGEIETLYRVEKIAPPTMTLTYLPLQRQQTLAIGSAE